MRLEGPEQVVVFLRSFVDADLLHAHLVGGPVRFNEESSGVHQHPLLHVGRNVRLRAVRIQELVLTVPVGGALRGQKFSLQLRLIPIRRKTQVISQVLPR